MKVNPAINTAVQGTDIKGADSANKSERTKKANYGGASTADVSSNKSTSTAEISTKAKELANDAAKATQLAKDSPDVREAKIAELKDKIANKKYNVSAAEISDRLVDDHIRMAGA